MPLTKQGRKDRAEIRRLGITSLRSYAKFAKKRNMPRKYSTGQRIYQRNHMRRRRRLQRAFYGPQWRFRRLTKRSRMR